MSPFWKPPRSVSSMSRSMSASWASRSGITEFSSRSFFTVNRSSLWFNVVHSPFVLSILFLPSSSRFSRSALTASASLFTALRTSSASNCFSFTPGNSCSSAVVSCSSCSRLSFARRTASSRARTRWRPLYSAMPAFSDARFSMSISARKLVVVLFASRLDDLRAACRVACSACRPFS